MERFSRCLLVGFVLSALAVGGLAADQKKANEAVTTVPQKTKVNPAASSALKKMNEDKAKLFGIQFPRKNQTGDHRATVAKIEFCVIFTKPVRKEK
jgi:hypothetical protein